MDKPLTFVIYGEPKGQGRPRFARIKDRTIAFDPSVSKEYKAFVKYVAQAAMQECGWTCAAKGVPISICITAYFNAPTKPKKLVEQIAKGKTRPTKKPDVDNIQKIIYDAISKDLVYHDDNQIVECHCHKYYSDEPKVIVRVDVVGDKNE